jgi:hypothetical protein
MYTPSDRSQFQANLVKHDKHKLPIEQQEILNWISEQFGVKALYFSCEKREPSEGTAQQLVHLIFETVDDVKKIQASRATNTAIAGKFMAYLKSTSEVIVTCRPLKKLSSEILNEMLDDEKRSILKTFENVWTISQSVIFYFTASQVKENQVNGISKKIGEELEAADEKYGVSQNSPYRFDSKETFDRDYESKWHYYWK